MEAAKRGARRHWRSKPSFSKIHGIRGAAQVYAKARASRQTLHLMVKRLRNGALCLCAKSSVAAFGFRVEPKKSEMKPSRDGLLSKGVVSSAFVSAPFHLRCVFTA